VLVGQCGSAEGSDDRKAGDETGTQMVVTRHEALPLGFSRLSVRHVSVLPVGAAATL
jgi:hypothetical protein